MFRRLATETNKGRELLGLHPMELMQLLEHGWNIRKHDTAADVGQPQHRSDVRGLDDPERPLPADPPAAATPVNGFDFFKNYMTNAATKNHGLLADHLVYAYMVENTRVIEIFRRVLHEFMHGERLGVPTADAQHWLRTTEAFFFRDPPPYAIHAIASQIRPDGGASRRNAYQRMFGMDLNHGTDDGKPYAYVAAEAANREFVATFEEFLREIWVGIANVGNASGANPTDDAKIADLARKLHDMLLARRISGNLSREEFSFVSFLSWFHLTLDTDTPIVMSLSAQAQSPEQRLFKIAQRVGLPAHGLAKSYFDIAEPLSELLITVEEDAYKDANAAQALYKDALTQKTVKTIITHWSIITGRDVKSGKVATT